MSGLVSKRKLDIVGKEFETNNCGKCVVLDYKGAYDVTVKFYNPKYIKRCTISSLKRGTVLNPYSPSVLGKGFFGEGKYTSKDIQYPLWKGVLRRCYDSESKYVSSSYNGAEVCDEWLNFQNFAEWCEGQTFFNAKDEDGKVYHLDKDILVKGNKVYSPSTCCFVPQKINKILLSSTSTRGNLPVGVTENKRDSNYVSKVRNGGKLAKHLGYYKTPEEAFEAYKKAKESYIKEVADYYKEVKSSQTYYALVNYEVEITD